MHLFFEIVIDFCNFDYFLGIIRRFYGSRMPNLPSHISILILLPNCPSSHLPSHLLLPDALLTDRAIGALIVPPLLLRIFRASQLLELDLSSLVGLEAGLECLLLTPRIEKVVLRGSAGECSLLEGLGLVFIATDNPYFLFVFFEIGNIGVDPIIKFVIYELPQSGGLQVCVIYIVGGVALALLKGIRRNIIRHRVSVGSLDWVVFPEVLVVEDVFDVGVLGGIGAGRRRIALHGHFLDGGLAATGGLDGLLGVDPEIVRVDPGVLQRLSHRLGFDNLILWFVDSIPRVLHLPCLLF